MYNQFRKRIITTSLLFAGIGALVAGWLVAGFWSGTDLGVILLFVWFGFVCIQTTEEKEAERAKQKLEQEAAKVRQEAALAQWNVEAEERRARQEAANAKEAARWEALTSEEKQVELLEKMNRKLDATNKKLAATNRELETANNRPVTTTYTTYRKKRSSFFFLWW